MLATTDPRALFWSDPGILRWKAEKAVGAFYAVSEALGDQGEKLGSESEFRELFRWSETIDAEAFHQVATDPRFYHWARLAYQILAAVRHGESLAPTAQAYLAAANHESLEDLLQWHLEQFKVFALALAVCSGRSLAFEPVRVSLPLAIPATRWSLEGEAEVELAGLDRAGALRAVVDGHQVSLPLPSESLQWAPTLAIQVAPKALDESTPLILQPHAFHIPGLQAITSVVSAGIPFQRECVDVLQGAIAAIERYMPETCEQFRRGMRVVALKPASAGGVLNTSCSRLPGAAIFTATSQPYALAEDLIHEFYHNRLFALEEAHDFLTPADFDPVRDEQFYSPWREDPRPLYGLLHADYVFERVLHYWLEVFQDPSVEPGVRSYAKSRIACLRVQLEVTTHQLSRFATFSDFGQQLFGELKQLVALAAQRADDLKIDDSVASQTARPDGSFENDEDSAGRAVSAGSCLRDHRDRFDVFHRYGSIENQCSDAVRRVFSSPGSQAALRR